MAPCESQQWTSWVLDKRVTQTYNFRTRIVRLAKGPSARVEHDGLVVVEHIDERHPPATVWPAIPGAARPPVHGVRVGPRTDAVVDVAVIPASVVADPDPFSGHSLRELGFAVSSLGSRLGRGICKVTIRLCSKRASTIHVPTCGQHRIPLRRVR